MIRFGLKINDPVMFAENGRNRLGCVFSFTPENVVVEVQNDRPRVLAPEQLTIVGGRGANVTPLFIG